MTTLNVPGISRRKPAPPTYDGNSFRVFGDAEEYRANYVRPQDKPQQAIQTYDKTLNLPSWCYNTHVEPERNIRDRNKTQVTYLRRNVRTLNHPVCYVPSQENGAHWWPSGVPSLTKPSPPKSKSSTMRSDFDWTDEHRSYGSNRHKNHVTKPALGTVPVNELGEKDGSQRFYQEKISYEHQYDSRWEKNYPIRSTRHGAFVTEPISNEKAAKMIQDPERWRLDALVKPSQSDNTAAENHTTGILPAGILPGLAESSCRKSDVPNHKRREMFDIAPRSNLNVRIREYVPSAISSAPQRIPQVQSSNSVPSKDHPAACQPEPAVQPECKPDTTGPE